MLSESNLPVTRRGSMGTTLSAPGFECFISTGKALFLPRWSIMVITGATKARFAFLPGLSREVAHKLHWDIVSRIKNAVENGEDMRGVVSEFFATFAANHMIDPSHSYF